MIATAHAWHLSAGQAPCAIPATLLDPLVSVHCLLSRNQLRISNTIEVARLQR